MLHEKVGYAIEKLYRENLDMVVPDLVYHFSRTDVAEKKWEYSLAAGNNAKRLYSMDEALSFYGIALESLEKVTRKSLGDGISKDREVEFFNSLAETCTILGRWDEGIHYYERAEELSDDRLKKAELKSRIAFLNLKKGMVPEALELCTEAYDSIKDIESKETITVLNALGMCHEKAFKTDKAIDFYEMSIEIGLRLDDRNSLASSYYYLAAAHFSKGDIQTALKACQKSLEIHEENQNLDWMGRLFNLMGAIHGLKGEYHKTLELLHKCLAIEEKIGSQYRIANYLNNIGWVHNKLGDYDNALEFFKKCLRIGLKIDDKELIAVSYSNIGRIYYEIGEYSQAREYLENGLDLRKELGDKHGIAHSYNTLGTINFELGEMDSALAYYEKSLDICKEIDIKLLTVDNIRRIAEVFASKKEYKKALEYCDEASKLIDSLGSREYEALNSKTMASIYREYDKPDLAKKYSEKAIRICRETEMEVELAHALFEFALLLKKTEELKAAESRLLEALDIFNAKNLQKYVERTENELAALR
jgi:tetratricopeptide (TPR) repeat protein